MYIRNSIDLFWTDVNIKFRNTPEQVSSENHKTLVKTGTIVGSKGQDYKNPNLIPLYLGMGTASNQKFTRLNLESVWQRIDNTCTFQPICF